VFVADPITDEVGLIWLDHGIHVWMFGAPASGAVSLAVGRSAGSTAATRRCPDRGVHMRSAPTDAAFPLP